MKLKRFRVLHYCDLLDKDVFIKHYKSLFIANIVVKRLERKFKRPNHAIVLTDTECNQVLNSGY